MNYMIITSLDQFEVVNLISINAPILGYLNISLTHIGLYSILVLFTIIGLHYYNNNNNKNTKTKDKNTVPLIHAIIEGIFFTL